MMIRFEIPSLKWATRPATLVLSYCAWILFVRLVTLTLITFLMISPTSRFQDISEAFSSTEVSMMGICALLFVCLIYWLNPMTMVQRYEIVSRPHLERQFLPGILNGIFAASFFVFALSLVGIYQNLGYLIRLQDAPFELGNIVLRMAILAIFVYFEEFIFRYQLFRYLPDQVSEVVTVTGIGIIYCLIKNVQFNLSILQTVTLFLVSSALCFRTLSGEGFSKGAGIWAGILIIFHPLLSLPIFGNSFSGILLMKPEGGFRFLTGGLGGPLSSIGFQLLLILDIARSMLKQRTPVFVKAG
jgi:hypothetical protein